MSDERLNVSDMSAYSGLGRDELLRVIRVLSERQAEDAHVLAALQERCEGLTVELAAEHSYRQSLEGCLAADTMRAEDLTEECERLKRECEGLKRERDSYLINLTSVQTRCTELLGSLRNAKATIRDERAQQPGSGATAYELGRKDGEFLAWKKTVNVEYDLCGLCGNTGTIDTRDHVVSPAGISCGVVGWCICPSGQALSEKSGTERRAHGR